MYHTLREALRLIRFHNEGEETVDGVIGVELGVGGGAVVTFAAASDNATSSSRLVACSKKLLNV